MQVAGLDSAARAGKETKDCGSIFTVIQFNFWTTALEAMKWLRNEVTPVRVAALETVTKRSSAVAGSAFLV